MAEAVMYNEGEIKVTLNSWDFFSAIPGTYPHLHVHVKGPDGNARFFTYKWKQGTDNVIHFNHVYLDQIGPGKMLEIDPSPIARAGYSEVYKGITNRQVLVAVKKIKSIKWIKGNKENEEKKFGEMATAYVEAALLASFKHKNIVELIAIVPQVDNPPWLVFEFTTNGSLFKLLGMEEKPMEYNDELKTSITMDIIAGMEYLHSNLLIHRDLTTRNILIDGKFTAKLTDFGLSTFLDGKISVYQMTPMGTGDDFRRIAYSLYYTAPEVLSSYKKQVKSNLSFVLSRIFYKDEEYVFEREPSAEDEEEIPESTYYLGPGEYSFESDIWSFGVVLHQIWTDGSHDPYSNTDEDIPDPDEFEEWIKNYNNEGINPCQYVPISEAHPNIKLILDKIFKLQPKKRPEFAQIKEMLMDTNS